MKLRGINKRNEAYYLPEFLMNASWWQIGNSLVYHVLQLLLLISLVASVLTENIVILMICVAIALVNLTIYLNKKQRYEIYFTSLSELKNVFDFANWMKTNYNDEDMFISDEVRNALQKLKKMSSLIFRMDNRRQA